MGAALSFLNVSVDPQMFALRRLALLAVNEIRSDPTVRRHWRVISRSLVQQCIAEVDFELRGRPEQVQALTWLCQTLGGYSRNQRLRWPSERAAHAAVVVGVERTTQSVLAWWCTHQEELRSLGVDRAELRILGEEFSEIVRYIRWEMVRDEDDVPGFAVPTAAVNRFGAQSLVA